MLHSRQGELGGRCCSTEPSLPANYTKLSVGRRHWATSLASAGVPAFHSRRGVALVGLSETPPSNFNRTLFSNLRDLGWPSPSTNRQVPRGFSCPNLVNLTSNNAQQHGMPLIFTSRLAPHGRNRSGAQPRQRHDVHAKPADPPKPTQKRQSKGRLTAMDDLRQWLPAFGQSFRLTRRKRRSVGTYKTACCVPCIEVNDANRKWKLRRDHSRHNPNSRER